MKITPLHNPEIYKSTNTNTKNVRYPYLSPLKYDTVSFGAMKKKAFSGIDFAVVEKFKAPIEKFNNHEDFQNWAKYKAEEIASQNYRGRRNETRIQRGKILKEWSEYVFTENDGYTNAMALLILNAVTKDLQADNDTLPPVLNKGVLADCMKEIDENTKQNPKYQFDLSKMYQNKLNVFYLSDKLNPTGETDTKWVVIPSKKHDPENFRTNVEKLKALSYKTWCTKTFNAEPYLATGDFHVYLENGQPKLGVRFVGDKIQEIQGERNNGNIPVTYLEIVDSHIKGNSFPLSVNAEKELISAYKIKKEIEKIQTDLREALEKNEEKTILEYFGIGVAEDKDGYLIITDYKQPADFYTFGDIGIDEKKLFRKIKSIKGTANFKDSRLTALGSLQSIGGNAYFRDSHITDLGKLQYIGGEADFSNSPIMKLGNLQNIGRRVFFRNSPVTSLGNLQSIGEDISLGGTNIRDLGKLQYIGGDADFQNSLVMSLGNLQNIGWNAYFSNSLLMDLGNLQSVGGNIFIKNSKFTISDFDNIPNGGIITRSLML